MKSSHGPFWNSHWFEKARRSDFARFSFALLCTLGAANSWMVMERPLNDATPYQVLLPFVALAAWFGGSGPGILTTILCVAWALTHSNGEFISVHQQLELLLFIPIGAFIAGLCGSLGQAREQAQAVASQLAFSQQRYQSMVETAAEGIWVTDADLKTSFVNERMASLLGTTPGEMLGRSVGEYLFETDQSGTAPNVLTDLEQGHSETEARYRHASGAEIWFMVNASLLRDEKGQISGVLALYTDVTDRRGQSEELRISHERFQMATRAIAGFIYECNMASGEVFRSTGFSNVLGNDPTAVPGTYVWWREQIHPEDIGNFDAVLNEALAYGNQFSVEYRGRHADGSYRWLWDRGLVTRREDDSVICIVGSVSDISGHKNAENALRESEANFRQLANSMPQIVWASNAQGVPDYFNRRWYDYSGQELGTVGSESWEPFHHPDDAPHTRNQWNHSIANGVIYRTEIRLRDRNGNYRWFLCRANAVKDTNTGEVVRWFGTATDIDEQRRTSDAQKFLAEVGVLLSGSLDPQITLEQVTRLAVPHLGDWCFVALKNAEGRPEMVAAAHHDAEKISAFWKQHHKFGFGPGISRGFPSVIRTGKPEIIEEVESQHEMSAAGHRSSMVVPLEVRGEILGALGFSYSESNRRFSKADLPLAQEIARRAAIAIENARLFRRLQDADRSKDEFLAMLAHELRNPLAAISGARYLMDELLEGEARAITVTPRAILERQTSHLSRLVDDLLDVSRITRGKIELRRHDVDFGEIVKGALDGVRPLILSRRHNLMVEMPGEKLMVNADPARLGQIVSNLVTNAAKYTEPGGQIAVTVSVVQNEVQLHVRDNGSGLTSEMLNSIWELFVQNDRTLERSQGGLGIGLTLVKSLAEMHGGRVGVQSEGLGQGSEFLVALPLLRPRQENSSAEIQEVPQPASPKATLQKKVLVVDDNQDAALMLCAWLETEGHDVQVAHDGAQGLILACGWQPEIALLDIGMPGMDGYEVARQLRSLPEGQDMRLIAVTGYGQPADRDQAFEAGFDFHLTKPVEMAELMRLIDTLD